MTEDEKNDTLVAVACLVFGWLMLSIFFGLLFHASITFLLLAIPALFLGFANIDLIIKLNKRK
jgi:hypothetical protein